MTENEQVITTIDDRLNGHGQVIVEEAQSSGLDLALACALVEQESGGRNIFGCDHGFIGDRPPYCHQQITKDRTKKLMDSRFMNGVGLTQLTWFTFVEEAEQLGGAHIPRNQCRVGFQLLKKYREKYPYLEALGAYNAGEENRRSVLTTYAAQLAERHTKWKALVGSRVGNPRPEQTNFRPEQTNFDRGIEYLLPAVGKTRYWFWPPTLAIVPPGPGAYAINQPPPDIDKVIEGRLFCQAVVNLIRRVNRKIVPTMGDERFDGGTWANQNFFSGFSEPFSRWAVYPRGTMVGRNFVWAGAPGASPVVDQGHVAVLLGEQNLAEQKDPMILQSHPAVDGLNFTRLGHSHDGGFYHYAIRPRNWINHDRGSF
jgi:hypothetical protein